MIQRILNYIRGWLRLHLLESEVRNEIQSFRSTVLNLEARVRLCEQRQHELSHAEEGFTDAIRAIAICAAHGTKLSNTIARRFGGTKEFEDNE